MSCTVYECKKVTFGTKLGVWIKESQGFMFINVQ